MVHMQPAPVFSVQHSLWPRRNSLVSSNSHSYYVSVRSVERNVRVLHAAFADLVDLLDLMRVASVEVVEAIVKWRRGLVRVPFVLRPRLLCRILLINVSEVVLSPFTHVWCKKA
jgi:hypothetical protein